jgi:acyl-CoA synthetase (AMP-forming)/AMP-acid ligase II/acyl carrier protein
MFPPLITGGCLHLVKKETRLDIQKYIGYLRKNRINNIDEVPVIMKEIFNTVVLDPNKELLPDLTCISLGSEYVPIDIVKKSRKYLNWHGKIINAYGPAEASVEATTYHFHGDLENEISLIGKPRSNTKIYIIDKHDNLSPIGVKGEICICSIGLARGYLNRVELTNSRFTINKFSSAFDGFLYKTGDQGRWLPDGNIEFLGRIDDQVKVRGFRIELGEIESILSKHEKVSENVVLAREDHGDKYLCAYVVFDQEQDIEDLRTYLAGILPDYMVPSYFIRLEEMPLTSNGKVNRKALPSPEIKASEDYTAASNDMEEKLVEIWSEVLNIPSGEISVTANFFALGGHSLKAMVLISKINKEFNIMISLVKIFEEPIIISMAMTIFNLAEQDKIIEEIEI